MRDVGTFLLDQIIYSVHFLDEGRLVGCRESETHGVVCQTHFDCLAGIPVWVPEVAPGEWRRLDDA